MIDTVIFDLDGTLLDTLEDLTDSTNYALKKFGLQERSIDEVRQFVGNGVDRLIRRAVAGALPEEKEAECLRTFKQYYAEHMYHKTKPYDGIMKLVKMLIQEQYRLAIVSNKFDPAVKELNRIYFENQFPVAIGASEGIAKKPAPDTVYEAMRQLGSSKENAIYVGDSDVDVMTAKKSGLPCIGVTWGFRDEELLTSLGADYIVHRPEEIMEILQH